MIDLIKSTRCYLLMCYSGDVDVDLRGGLEKLGWTRNPTEGKLKLDWRKQKIRQKEKCFGDLQSVKTLLS